MRALPYLPIPNHPLPELFCASNLSSWRLRRNGWSISKYRMFSAWKLWEPQKLTRPCLEKNDLGWASLEKFLLVSHPNLSLSNSQRTVPVVASRPCAGQSCAPFQVRAGPGSAGDVTRASSITPCACVHGLGMWRGGNVYRCACRQPNW